MIHFSFVCGVCVCAFSYFFLEGRGEGEFIWLPFSCLSYMRPEAAIGSYTSSHSKSLCNNSSAYTMIIFFVKKNKRKTNEKLSLQRAITHTHVHTPTYLDTKKRFSILSVSYVCHSPWKLCRKRVLFLFYYYYYYEEEEEERAALFIFFYGLLKTKKKRNDGRRGRRR